MRHSHAPRRRRSPAVLAALISLLLVLAACASAATDAASAEPSEAASTEASASTAASEGAEPSDGAAQEVSINGTSFGADEITVAVGDTVTYTNHSSLPHTVTEGTDGNTADGARFNEDLPAGESVEITFEEAGDYDVTCLFHSNMNMVVHVE
ncbi:MAG TPA: plastocyanin/azurin family copper-binding protein [Candidatus Limnocylindria bacterium]|nr:plastocyanin/azurin family copper-binding protein [Candidatus Limnocylindria bacterium]